MVKRSMLPSSLESRRATLMLDSTVVAGNKCDATTPEAAGCRTGELMEEKEAAAIKVNARLLEVQALSDPQVERVP